MTFPHGLRYATLLRNLVPPLILLGTVLVLVSLVVQSRAGAGGAVQAPGTGILRYGNSWSSLASCSNNKSWRWRSAK